jgi:hypothetical protein
MNKMNNVASRGCSPGKCLSVVLAAMAFAVTGCPRNQYVVELKPQGQHIERTLTFYREEGVNTNTGAPHYQTFDAGELAAIAARYPASGLTNQGERHIARGVFTNELPSDVGGSGVYTNLTTSLGEMGYYAERFRGNDDLAGMAERRFQAADRLADLMVGWSEMELGREPGYGKLRRYLDADFRRDLKNVGAYWWEGQLTDNYKTNSSEEFVARFGQYLFERGYFRMGDVPGLYRAVSGDDSPALLRRIQRLVADKMEVPAGDPLPAALAFLADPETMGKSFDKYLAGTDVYRARLKQWEDEKKLKPDAKQPESLGVAGDAVEQLIGFDLFGQSDHLVVRLSLPAAPDHSNGRWDKSKRQMVWESDIEGGTNATHFPFFCYAGWAQADTGYQKKHFGRVILTGDALSRYCLWRTAQEAHRGGQWDEFLAGLQPGKGLAKKLDAFRFPDETEPAGTNTQQNVNCPSAFPRDLLKAALR